MEINVKDLKLKIENIENLPKFEKYLVVFQSALFIFQNLKK